MSQEMDTSAERATTFEQMRLLDGWLDRVLDADDPQRARAHVLQEIRDRAPHLERRFLALLEADDASMMSWEGGAMRLIPQDREEALVVEESLDLGGWTIERELGRGGMGQVYLVHREHRGAEESFEQKGALKLMTRSLRPNLPFATTTNAIPHDHFLREMSTLAMLAEHPHIARFLDAGLTSGAATVPFFVMEYIDGEPVDVYCKNLDERARIGLVIELARAVHFMHQRGVIHRDLKPANILVTSQGHPKILDLGIAQTSHVEGSRAFTPGWSAPEQRGREGGVVTAAADIYNLGLLLELVLLGEDASRTREQRSSSSGEHRAVSAIIEVATKTSPEDRYASAEEFARDLERYLAGEIVEVLKEDRAYVFAHLARRHRVGIAATLAILAVVVFAGVMLVRQNFALQEARSDAVDARQVAEREADVARELSGFMEDVLTSANPVESGEGANVTVEQVLDQSAALILQNEAMRDASVQSTMLRVMADSYLGLGLSEKAAPLLERAVELTPLPERFVCQGRGEELEAARLCYSQGWVLRGQTRIEEAIAHHKQLVARCEDRDASAREGEEDIAAAALNEIADMYYWNLRDGDAAREHYLAALERSQGETADEISSRIFALAGVAITAAHTDEPEAERRARITEILALADRIWGPNHVERAKLYKQLSYSEIDPEDGIEHRKNALAVYEHIYGEDHIYVAGVLNDLALTYEFTDPELAMRYIERSHKILSEKLPENNKMRISVTRNFGGMLREQGRLEEAEKWLEWGYKQEPESIFSFSNLSLLRQAQGDMEEAIALNEKGLALLPSDPGEISFNYRHGFHVRLAGQYRMLSAYKEALEYYRLAATSAPGTDKAALEGVVFSMASTLVERAYRGAR
ncbi:MAG: protein kinase [Myxococcota bacterium]|nr:protein kinase [Myxococcota bacterium]